MSQRTSGWLFVAAQAGLLLALVLIPTGDSWPRPSWLLLISGVLTIGGLGVVIVAASHLGAALTPTPEPRSDATLRTDGFYRFVRHPIYSGVLVVVLGLALRSGNLLTVLVGAVTVVFFNVKAAWEERRLSAQYPSYSEYAARTPRFVPRPR